MKLIQLYIGSTQRKDWIMKLTKAYKNRQDVEKYAHLASFEEIKENDFNLNIPRYVDTFEEPEPIDIVQLSKEIVSINEEISQAEKEFLTMLDDLQVTEETKDLIEATKAVFSNE